MRDGKIQTTFVEIWESEWTGKHIKCHGHNIFLNDHDFKARVIHLLVCFLQLLSDVKQAWNRWEATILTLELRSAWRGQ